MESKVLSASYVGRAGEDRFAKIHLPQIQLYCVFDGHGGSKIVDQVVHKLPNRIAQLFMRTNLNQEDFLVRSIQRLYSELDEELSKTLSNDPSGSTASVVVITGNKIYFINLGDSRTILYNGHGKILFETTDHSPIDEYEKKRIETLGGHIITADIPRVQGILGVTRSFGDFELKRVFTSKTYQSMGWVSVIPDVFIYDIKPNTEPLRILLASDGLWDAFQSKAAAVFALNTGDPCWSLIDQAKKKTTDDITIIIVEIESKGRR